MSAQLGLAGRSASVDVMHEGLSFEIVRIRVGDFSLQLVQHLFGLLEASLLDGPNSQEVACLKILVLIAVLQRVKLGCDLINNLIKFFLLPSLHV